MPIQLVIFDNIIELDDNVTVNYQVNDIAELTDRQTTYSNSFDILRTPEVTNIFNQLGMAGDTSTRSREYVRASLLHDFVPIIKNGRLEVVKTNKCYYSVVIYEGIIDFFATIGEALFGDLNLSEIQHEKNTAAVVNTWDNDLPYRYLIANYGGLYSFGTHLVDFRINTDYQIPAVKVSYLWDKIFDSFGFTYSGSIFSEPDFQDLKITVPWSYEIIIDSSNQAMLADAISQSFSYNYNVALNVVNWTNTLGSTFIALNPDGSTFDVLEAGAYQISISLDGNGEYGPFFVFKSYIRLRIMASSFSYFIQADEDNPGSSIVKKNMEAGDLIVFAWEIDPNFSGSNARINVDNLTVDIIKIETESEITDDFFSLKVKDFFKEILWRFSLTAFTDANNRHVEFLTLDERLDPSNVEDWSLKYKERIEQSYIFGTYAKNNFFRYKYDIDGDDNSDGLLILNNDKYRTEITLLDSITFAPSNERKRVRINNNIISGPVLPDYITWSGDVDDDGSPNFSLLTKNFFFVKERSFPGPFRLDSFFLPQGAVIRASGYVADFQDLDYNSILEKRYAGLKDIVEAPRIERVLLCLSAVEANQTDLRKLYTFSQLGGIYIINRLAYRSGGFSEAELVKVKPIIPE